MKYVENKSVLDYLSFSFTLSTVKFSKRRRVESPPHVCPRRCYRLNSTSPFRKGDVTLEEEDVMNISDQNENEY